MVNCGVWVNARWAVGFSRFTMVLGRLSAEKVGLGMEEQWSGDGGGEVYMPSEASDFGVWEMFTHLVT